MDDIKKLFKQVSDSVFTIEPVFGGVELVEKIGELANLVHAHEGGDELWYLGENSHCDLASFIVGAYWFFSDHYAGQLSPEYATLCSLGQVFSPGLSTGPEEDTCEADVYAQLRELFPLDNVR